MVCPSCGYENDPAATHCVLCNHGLVSAQPQPQPQPARARFAPASYESPAPVPRSPMLPMLLAVAVVLLIGVIVGGVFLARQDRGGGAAAAPASSAAAAQPVPVAGDTLAAPTDPAPAPTDPATTTSARDQAAVIDSVLDRSVASRAKLNRAIGQVQRCTGLAGALADMRAVGSERNAQIARVNAADLSAVGDGEALRSALTTALGYSLSADRQFVDWAEPAVTGGCHGSAARSAAWDDGQAVSQQAQAAKQRFLDVWNPVADSLGFAERTAQHI